MVNWDEIETVLLDMDGTLLDLHFDNYFWQEYLPIEWGKQNNLDAQTARETLVPKFQAMHGTLSWYCVEYWSNELNLDVMALKNDIVNLIQPRPHCNNFLLHVKELNKQLVMVTNAHERLIDMKFDKTGIDSHFHDVISSHSLGHPKEDLEFWHELSKQISFKPEKSLLIDDNLTVLRTAGQYGIGFLLSIARPDSKRPEKDTEEFQAIDSFEQLIN
jgi:HAD superfamily hydrolase (TIGR01509 family)